MSTKFTKNVRDNVSIPTGYEGDNVTEDFHLPSCGLEDIDKAVFNLFENDMPFFYDEGEKRKKVPVIFATGERFAVLRRRQPLTDKSGAIILPLISITRNSLNSKPELGIANNQMHPQIIKKRLSKDDVRYQQLINKEKFKNSDNTKDTNTTSKDQVDYSRDGLLESSLGDNIFEVIEIPPVKYFGVSYEVTIWTLYTQQMNSFIETFMSSYTLNPRQEFRLESDKGYWFPAFFDESFSIDASHNEMSDSERYVRYTTNLNTTGYIINNTIKGGKSALRSTFSSPRVVFETLTLPDFINEPEYRGVASGEVDDYILQDLAGENDFIPGQVIGGVGLTNTEAYGSFDKTKANAAESDSRDISNGTNAPRKINPTDFVGNRSSDYNRSEYKLFHVSSNDGTKKPIRVKSSAKGETIYAGDLSEILDSFD